MPVDQTLYPPTWDAAVAIVADRAGGRCECTGECGLHGPLCRRCLVPFGTGKSRRCGRSVHMPETGRRERTWCIVCGRDTCSDYTPGDKRRCEERAGAQATWANGIVVLSTAHLNAPGGPCDCYPLCAETDHLKAMCSKCHLRYDAARHAWNRNRNAETRSGQVRLFPSPPMPGKGDR